jgi:hypothetical protein
MLIFLSYALFKFYVDFRIIIMLSTKNLYQVASEV